MTPSPLPLSVIDFASVRPGQSVGDALRDSVALARKAEELGYERVWYSEHHNMGSIASSAPAVLMAHIASQTQRIRLGSGGVMLPNHSPLVIAEQFGTLAELHPGRIDLGLGRAPGTDPQTFRALRRDPSAAERFPDDVRELQAFLGDSPSDLARTRGITATPGRGTRIPLYILGSSLFGAQLAAAYGLPYAFASHFAPDALEQASAVYRDRFEPSDQLAEPYMIAAVNVVADDDTERAAGELHWYRRQRVKLMAGRGRHFSDEELDMVMESAAGRQILHMISYTAVGDGPEVRDYLADFAERAGADELMIAPVGSSRERVHGSLEVLRRSWAA
ncbi:MULTISPECIES: LLM class flavin-dependent oxidoreductase [unclassified Dietzia]|uniref:LLM class flavin-dependent oxidoreductase n=1 Tax=unclassified Dietzia TaxID=2617939 RepID=UPI0015F8E981|nr:MULTISPECIES: LLM class flavin-dependent oxidoreductase [unclassified Dietzia]MBB1025774.1 LLM class flavin-dependent oxidoreductase [Dietzia sp. DQ12-76]MBB1028995.1 LLM class flavin-dependent oxidoreductase [Dietzia sp. DQ11-38-2]